MDEVYAGQTVHIRLVVPAGENVTPFVSNSYKS